MKHCICFILSAVFLLNLNGQEKEKNGMSAAGISRDKHVSLQPSQTIQHKNQERKMPRSREEIMKDINYDESRIPACTLPSPLDRKDGGRIATAYEWVNRRRPEVLALYQKEVYGQIPPRPDRMWFETLSVREDALDGAAIRKEIRLHFAMDNGKSHSFVMLLYIPKNAKAPSPVFLGLNFKGNHAATDEKDVMMTGKDLSGGIVHPDGHASQVHRWQFRETIRRGYASATVCYHDIFPDRNDEASWHHSIYGLFYPDKTPEEIHARYSAIGAWTWGLSRMLDCLEREPMIDSAKAMVHGHSRLGKTALWTGATDPRFRLVMSNDSGCGGAALFKRCIGENVEAILSSFPYWFVTPFANYIRNEAGMPFDQHWLISLIAPRPVCIASATEDLWADPKGEFLSGVHAAEVYRLFGAEGLGTDVMPQPDRPVTGEISYHLRTGKHDQTLEDWLHYWELADRLFRK